MHRTFALSTLVALSLMACPAAAEDCRLQLETSLPLSWDVLGRATVPVKIDGSDFDFLVDTGSVAPLLTTAVAHTLKLTAHVVEPAPAQIAPPARSAAPLAPTAPAAFDPSNNRIAIRDRYVAAKTVSLGRLDSSDMHFRIEPSVETARMSDGRIASQILRHYEVEFDFAGAKINLFNQRHCPGRLAYWTHDEPLEIPFHTDLDGHILVDVQLDGQKMEAVVNTGGSDTTLDGDAAGSLFHIDKAVNTKTARYYPFKTLSIGGLDVSSPAILVMPHRVVPDSELELPHLKMTIGMNVLRQLRMVVSYAEKKIYATAAAPDASSNQYGAFSAGLNANVRGADPEAINAFSVALQGNGLPASSLVGAHQGRAFAELRVDRCQDALDDVDAALSASSRSPYAHFLRGRALDCLDRQPEAGDEYSALIATGTQPGAYAFRGWLLWRSGDSNTAERDFSALTENGSPTQDYAFSDSLVLSHYNGEQPGTYVLSKSLPFFPNGYVWLAMVRARLGHSNGDLLGKTDRGWGEEPHTWPEPLFQLYGGGARPEDVLAAAVGPDQTCQANFYVAEWWLAQKNRTAARPLLENAAANCAHDQEEWRSARAELLRLNP